MCLPNSSHETIPDHKSANSASNSTGQPSGHSPIAADVRRETQPALRAFLLTVAYDGTNYFGWQRQPDQPTIQAHVERAMCAITGEKSLTAYASSRTDTGVHALGQSVMFRTSRWQAAAENIAFAMNTKLPLDIVVRESQEVPIGFHPLRDSCGKRYRYQIYSSRKGDPLHARTHWWIRRRLSLEDMRAAGHYILGEHDFCSFESTGSPRQSSIRHVRALNIDCAPHLDGKLVTIDIEANGFLYNMVRNIVGTLVQVGVGRQPPSWIPQVFAAKDRQVAGATAPPQGLCLLEVLY